MGIFVLELIRHYLQSEYYLKVDAKNFSWMIKIMATPLSSRFACDQLTYFPGSNGVNSSKEDFRRKKSFDYVNGFRIPRVNFLIEQIPYNLDNPNPNSQLIYGQQKKEVAEKFVPAYCYLENKILRFFGYIKETMVDCPDEIYRVRPLIINYYLSDNTIMVMEKHVENSGMVQGRLLHRQRIPKDDNGTSYNWTDFNIGKDIDLYGKAVRIVDCDKWTAEFLASEGVELGAVESIPPDPYTEKRISERPTMSYVVTPSNHDKRYQFQTHDKQVLRFYCVWDDRNTVYGELKPYILLYYLADDTIELHEIHKPNDGCDPTPSLIHRQKIAKSMKSAKCDVPSVILELTDQDVEWYGPKDFQIGKTVEILGRQFILYDCDKFTRDYYTAHFGISDFTPMDIKLPTKHKVSKLIPPHRGWGSPEDSFQSCIRVRPKPPCKDSIWAMEHATVSFRYSASLDSVDDLDAKRKFIISVHISNHTVSIFELPQPGFMGGPFLSRRPVRLPNCNPNKPEYYTYKDFYPGQTVEIFGRKFIIIAEDAFVAKYKASHPETFTDKLQITATDPREPSFKFESNEDADRICVPRDEFRKRQLVCRTY